MMLLSQKPETYFINDQRIELYVPEEQAIQQLYRNQKNKAYWAKVWPASVGLCLFLEEHPHWVRNKHILELAAGLGLPGLYTAAVAKQVTITDKEEMAEIWVRQSAKHLKLTNILAKTLNWNDAIQEPLPEVVLLSDVNYEPAVFAELKAVLEFFLRYQVTVVISTPQRLVAKPFITELLPYSHLQWNCTVSLQKKETGISVFVLK